MFQSKQQKQRAVAKRLNERFNIDKNSKKRRGGKKQSSIHPLTNANKSLSAAASDDSIFSNDSDYQNVKSEAFITNKNKKTTFKALRRSKTMNSDSSSPSNNASSSSSSSSSSHSFNKHKFGKHKFRTSALKDRNSTDHTFSPRSTSDDENAIKRSQTFTNKYRRNKRSIMNKNKNTIKEEPDKEEEPDLFRVSSAHTPNSSQFKRKKGKQQKMKMNETKRSNSISTGSNGNQSGGNRSRSSSVKEAQRYDKNAGGVIDYVSDGELNLHKTKTRKKSNSTIARGKRKYFTKGNNSYLSNKNSNNTKDKPHISTPSYSNDNHYV